MDERQVRLYFDISVFLKGFVSFVEVVAGTLAFFVPVSAVTDFLIRTVGDELSEHSDVLGGYLIHSAQALSVQSGTFIALYLLSRGLIKLLLVVALFKNQLWAYPSSLVVLGAFVAYQCYQFAAGHSLFIAALTIFDLVVMYFIWREWRVLKALQTSKSS